MPTRIRSVSPAVEFPVAEFPAVESSVVEWSGTVPSRSSVLFLSLWALLSVGLFPAPGGAVQVDDNSATVDERIRFPDGSGGQNQPEHLNAP